MLLLILWEADNSMIAKVRVAFTGVDGPYGEPNRHFSRSRMISSFPEAVYLVPRRPHRRSCFFEQQLSRVSSATTSLSCAASASVPGSGYFRAKLKGECVKSEIFHSLKEAQIVIEK